MRSFVSTGLVRVTGVLTVLALLLFSASAGLFDVSRPARAATAALSSPAGQRLATDFIADQLLVAVPGLGEKKAHALAAKVAADPATLVALKRANLKSASAPQDRAALLDVVADQLKQSDPKVAAATGKYADRVKAAASSGPADPDGKALAEPPSPAGNLLKQVQQLTGDAPNVSAAMSDLKERLAHYARILAVLALLTAAGALAIAPSRFRVVRSFGWMLVGISFIPAAIGWLVPDLVLARMSSDWAQALAVGLRVGGGRLIGLFVALLGAGVALLVVGMVGPRAGALATSARAPGEGQRPGPSYPPAGRPPVAQQGYAGPYAPDEVAATRPMPTTPDDPYAPAPSPYPYPRPYQNPDYDPYDDRPPGSAR